MRPVGSPASSGFQAAGGRDGQQCYCGEKDQDLEARLQFQRQRPGDGVGIGVSDKQCDLENSMQTIQVAALPPNHGRMYFAITG